MLTILCGGIVDLSINPHKCKETKTTKQEGSQLVEKSIFYINWSVYSMLVKQQKLKRTIMLLYHKCSLIKITEFNVILLDNNMINCVCEKSSKTCNFTET